MPNRVDLSGCRFGRMVATRAVGKTKHGSILWECRCDCGSTALRSVSALRGGTMSCGCALKEARRSNGKRNRRHGASHTPTWNAWQRMWRRTKHHQHYIRLGITVCHRWRLFENFLSDMGVIPNGMTLGRINNAKGYYPGNCRWEDKKQQARNRSTSRLLTHRGKTQCLALWAEEANLPAGMVWKRLRRGWPLSKALTQ